MVDNAFPSLHPCLRHPLPTGLSQEREFQTNLHRLYRPSCSTITDRPWDSSSFLVRPLWLELASTIMLIMLRLARNDPSLNISELACDATTPINRASEMPQRNLQECQVSAESFSQSFVHRNAPTLSHDPEDPPTYSEAVAAP